MYDETNQYFVIEVTARLSLFVNQRFLFDFFVRVENIEKTIINNWNSNKKHVVELINPNVENESS